MNKTLQALINYANKTITRKELLQELIVGSARIIAERINSDSSTIHIQDFIREGKSFIPLFSDAITANNLLYGAQSQPGMQVLEVKISWLANMLGGSEWLVIDAGDEYMFEMYAYEIKPTKRRLRVLSRPTPGKIGMPSHLPSAESLHEMRLALSSTKAQTVYWFWISLLNEKGHLGLAVAPALPEIMNEAGDAIEPIWAKHRLSNPRIDLLPLDDSELSEIIQKRGQVLYKA